MRPRTRGTFVVVEGIDGAGKSTFVRALAGAIRRRRGSVATRREPADPQLGRWAQQARDPWTSATYFTLDRFLARPELERALARRRWVLQDRSFYSTLAYQGSLLGPAARRRLATLQSTVTIPPDRVVLLDLAPTIALRRLGRRGTARAPFEHRRTLEQVRRAYRSLARGRRWIVLDARQPTSQLVTEALRRLGTDFVGASRPPKKIRAARVPRRHP